MKFNPGIFRYGHSVFKRYSWISKVQKFKENQKCKTADLTLFSGTLPYA